MAMKTATKFERKLTCASNNDMKNLTDVYQSTRKSQN